MGLLAWLLLGLVAGALAQLVVHGQERGCGCTGLIITIAVGLAGAVIGGIIGTQLGWGKVDHFDVRSLGLAFLGAVIVLLILEAIRGRD